MSTLQATTADPRRLPRDCSQATHVREFDRTLFSSDAAAIGEFRCPVGHPSFGDSGPTERCIVVFPRTSVWIAHEGSRPFVADPTVVTIYNRAQHYRRAPLSPEGDRCDWFGVADSVAREIAAAFDPRAEARGDRPFQFQYASGSVALYLAQRRLVHRAASARSSALQLEQAVVELVTSVLASAYRAASLRPVMQGVRGTRHRDLAEQAKQELLRTFTENRSVSEIASAIGTSAFHLCRVFRAETGQTLHDYRMALRVRAALERLSDGGTSLSAVAHDLGFSSHSHLVTVFKRQLGAVPGAVRAMLGAE